MSNILNGNDVSETLLAKHWAAIESMAAALKRTVEEEVAILRTGGQVELGYSLGS